jgi:hypothetical protein
MVKAKDFLHFICVEQEYKLFFGLPDLDFKPVYKAMDANIMHYIPALDINIAVNFAIGNIFGGIKSVVLTDLKNFNRFEKELIKFAPVLFLLPEEVKEPGFLNTGLVSFEDLKKVLDKSFSSIKPVTIGLGGQLL